VWRRFSSEPFEVGQPELDERANRILDPRRARELERLLIALPDFLDLDSLFEPVVAGDEQPLDLGPYLVARGVHIRSLARQDHLGAR
jgi:hypothetical protein